MSAPAGRRFRRARGALAAAVALAGVGAIGPARAGAAVLSAAVPAAPACSGSEQNPTSGSGYVFPIANRIQGGALSQGTTTVDNIDAVICGGLRFPSLSADIPTSHITYAQPSNLTVAGIISNGTADITADGPSLAVTSTKPAPNGGLVFTLTAEVSVALNIGAIPALGLTAPVSCHVGLDLHLNTDPSEGGKALVGPLTGAEGTIYGPKGKVTVTALSAENPADSLEVTACSLLNSVLKTSTTPATFTATLYLYTTFTSF